MAIFMLERRCCAYPQCNLLLAFNLDECQNVNNSNVNEHWQEDDDEKIEIDEAKSGMNVAFQQSLQFRVT